jgi:hypothetical protein
VPQLSADQPRPAFSPAPSFTISVRSTKLTYNRSFSYSTRGQLLGHMIIELEMLQAKLPLVPGFPESLKTLVEAPHHQPSLDNMISARPNCPCSPKR